MSYVTPPGPRIAYDLDGTVGLVRESDNVVRDLHPKALKAMNAERTYGAVFSNMRSRDPSVPFVGLVFPRPMRLHAVAVSWLATDNSGATTRSLSEMRIDTSVDSTNIVDGTWVTDVARSVVLSSTSIGRIDGVRWDGTLDGWTRHDPINDRYRRFAADGGLIVPVVGTGTRHVTAMKIRPLTGSSSSWITWDFVHVHLYGEPDTSGDDQRLAFWQVSSDEKTTPGWFDWGDVYPSSSADKMFRIKNLDETKTAHEIAISVVAPVSSTVPAPDASLLLSLDGSTWLQTVEIAALGPGATSVPITVRRVTPANAVLSNWAPRITVDALGGWS